MGSLKKAAKSFGVVCGALISPEVNYDQISIMQSVRGRTVFPKFSVVFFFAGFFSPWKTPKPVSWNSYAFYSLFSFTM